MAFQSNMKKLFNNRIKDNNYRILGLKLPNIMESPTHTLKKKILTIIETPSNKTNSP